jgi:hypothetical protein
VREYRERQKNARLPSEETLPRVTSGNARNALQQRTTQDSREEDRTKRTALLPGLIELETEIRRHRIFAALDATAIARKQAERLITAPQKTAWLVAAIAECAEKSAGLGLNSEALTGKLVAFMRNARRPKGAPSEPPARVEFVDHEQPTDDELEANRRRMDERSAALRAERERREKIDAELAAGEKGNPR